VKLFVCGISDGRLLTALFQWQTLFRIAPTTGDNNGVAEIGDYQEKSCVLRTVPLLVKYVTNRLRQFLSGGWFHKELSNPNLAGRTSSIRLES
jgi:hypothetical protein